MKLLQFAEDVRPAYYGTITRKSNSISATDPFAKDSDLIDYDMDSEAEWEPEGEGEDIHSGDEDEDDTAIELDNSEDAGWLVPEGYLSENEGGEDNDGRKIHRKNSSTKRTFIRKIVLGPYFEGESEGGEAMKPFEAQFFLDDMQEAYDPFKKDVVIKTPCSVAAPVINVSKSEFTEVHTNALIDLINVKPSDSIPHLLTEAKSNMLLQNISKRQLEAKIKNIAVKEKRGADTRSAWYVKEPNSS
ncbi:chromatin assembly factor 1 subunit A-domain-containing protein [Pilobolus umbonatus]|nr:chromatin assembly factor 1 subunit A-domain-containing protein [Pilobolus umbonatus]